LLHVTDIAWTRLKHPSEALKTGQKVDVLVLEVDREAGKVSLGLKQLLPDPWKKAPRNYRTGKLVKGTITRIVPSGAFVHLEDGIEGIIPVGEISERRVASPSEVVQVGQEVEVKVVQVRAKQRRMTLSLKEAQHDQEKREYRQFMDNQKPGTVTLGEVFGQLLTDSTAPPEASEAAAPPDPAEADRSEEVSDRSYLSSDVDEAPEAEASREEADTPETGEPVEAELARDEENSSPARDDATDAVCES
jgi:predicted RNA-binding protein with RPS1 domain